MRSQGIQVEVHDTLLSEKTRSLLPFLGHKGVLIQWITRETHCCWFKRHRVICYPYLLRNLSPFHIIKWPKSGSFWATLVSAHTVVEQIWCQPAALNAEAFSRLLRVGISSSSTLSQKHMWQESRAAGMSPSTLQMMLAWIFFFLSLLKWNPKTFASYLGIFNSSKAMVKHHSWNHAFPGMPSLHIKSLTDL